MRRLLPGVVSVFLLSGCETLNPITIGVGLASYATTGKGLADHAIGTLTQKDCNILGGILSAERSICEPVGSAAASVGFKGLLFASRESPPELRLSETLREMPITSAESADTAVVAEPQLRLSDSITPAEVPIPGRLAAAELGPSS